MLRLQNITKDYTTGDTTVHALRGVDVRFRKNEFVAVLGPSGCGKTTLLNIIGGLDRYTDGDLYIAGRSTKEFKDADWDSYRNHSIGFVFQSYNLIPHQTVLSNVELALTLSGVKKAERRRLAKEALERVGLGDQLRKKPNEMSGGQMQRVAIARALVNDPEILLADEPTGALDSETSVQIMELLKEVAKDRLVIMVTHNPELADAYATRIVRLLDGRIVSDSDPYEVAEFEAVKNEKISKQKKQKQKKVSMSFGTALGLSLNNLMTKKARTFLTAFAGSIGIIGIALILSLSNGIQLYIEGIQKDTLSSYPITINAEETDISSLLSSIRGDRENNENAHGDDAVYSSSVMYELINSMISAEKKQNDLPPFKNYLETDDTIREYISAVQYVYDVDLNVYAKDCESGKFVHADVEELMTAVSGASGAFTSMYSQFSGIKVFEEMLPGENGELVSPLIKDQYDLVYGSWPKSKNELILVLDRRNEITDITQYALGLVSGDEMKEITLSAMKGEEIEIKDRSWSYEEICALQLKLILTADLYKDAEGDGVYESIAEDEQMLDLAVSSAPDLHIVGIVRPNEDANAASLNGSIAYTSELTKYIIEKTAESPVVVAQQLPENENVDLRTGLPFKIDEKDLPKQEEKSAAFTEYAATLDDAGKAELYLKILSTPEDAVLEEQIAGYMEKMGDRTAKEDYILQQYGENTGYDEETIREYFASLSDEELDTLISDGIRQMLLATAAAQAEKTISQIAMTPSPEELAGMSAQILAALPDRTAKEGYLAADWSKNTGMDQMAIFAYLRSLSDEQLEEQVMALVNEQAAANYAAYAQAIPAETKNAKIAAALDAYLSTLDESELQSAYDRFMPSQESESSLAENLRILGVADLDSPASINIYADTFEKKDAIADEITRYNEGKDEEQQISYTDYVALLMSSVTQIVQFVSYGLIAFVSISLVVSSIMIGIITYISVLERTKEIGILRSIGASKRNIATVFNAETLVIGFCSGVFGILCTLLLCWPVSAILEHLSGVADIAKLPWQGAVALILISMLLTLIAGIIPSRIASKKDPVVALRSE